MFIRAISPSKQTLLICFALVLLLLAAGCTGGPLLNFPAKTAKDAVIQEFNRDIQRRKATIDRNTVQILQEQPVKEDIVFFLLSFQELREDGEQLLCLDYYGAKQGRQGWDVQGSGRGCWPPGQQAPDGKPISVGRVGGWSRDADGLTFSAAEGYVFSNRIAGIDITWDDDVRQHAEVVNHTYLAVRLETRTVKKIEALDASGAIVYTDLP